MNRLILLAFFTYAVDSATRHHYCLCYPPRSVPQTAFCSNYSLTKIRGCRPLSVLGLNPLKTIERMIGSDSFANRHHYDLQIVRLDHNRLKEISGDVFGDLKNLEEVDLSHNIIRIRIPPQTFENNTKLRSIDLSHNNLGLTAEKPILASHTAEVLKATNCGFVLIDSTTFVLPKLRNLNLSANVINVFETSTFSSFAKISTLDLSFNNIAIASINFSVAANLEFLDLSYNKLGTSTLLPLLSNIYLLTLNMSGCGLKTITKQTFNTPRLKVLNVSKNEIELLEENAFFLMHYLYSLDLSMNKLKNLDFSLAIPYVNFFGNPWTCDCDFLNPYMTSAFFYNAICFDSGSFTGVPVSKFHKGDYCYRMNSTDEDSNVQNVTIERYTYARPQTETYPLINASKVQETSSLQKGTDVSMPILTIVIITISVCGILACPCIIILIRAYRRRKLPTTKDKSIQRSEMSIKMYEKVSYDCSDKAIRWNSPQNYYLQVKDPDDESNYYLTPTQNDYEEVK